MKLGIELFFDSFLKFIGSCVDKIIDIELVRCATTEPNGNFVETEI
ncbi:hypothetical protein HYT56_01170 [Candidatus Woesearchaeota archaeon]|nr:hypothetical protein [Candidatus Woesearchaeota archaeon]